MLTVVDRSPADAQADRLSRQRDALVTGHLHLVRRIAQQMIVNLPGSVDVEDLIQSGMVGLLEAAQRYQSTQGASFATYSYYRIRGAMIDTIRASLWMSRDTIRRMGQFNKVKRQLGRSAADGTLPSSAQIAAAAGVSTDVYFRTLRDVRQSKELSLEECLSPTDPTQGPEAQVERDEALLLLRKALGRLDASERELVALYYGEERLLREIGDMRNISESRVCQIQKRILERLRTVMTAK